MSVAVWHGCKSLKISEWASECANERVNEQQHSAHFLLSFIHGDAVVDQMTRHIVTFRKTKKIHSYIFDFVFGLVCNEQMIDIIMLIIIIFYVRRHWRHYDVFDNERRQKHGQTNQNNKLLMCCFLRTFS